MAVQKEEGAPLRRAGGPQSWRRPSVYVGAGSSERKPLQIPARRRIRWRCRGRRAQSEDHKSDRPQVPL